MNSSEVHSKGGSPALYVDGERQIPMLLGLSDFPGASTITAYAQKNIANFASVGIHLLSADVQLCNGWHKHSPFDIDSIRAEIAAAMEADPETHVLLRFHVNPPYWWVKDNPDECVRYRDFELIDDGEHRGRLIANDSSHHLRASIASEKWLLETGEKIRECCEMLWDTPEGRAVLGIQVAYGLWGEWSQFGPDRSKPMIRRFRRFLREKYKTEEALKKAWGNPYVTFDDAPFAPEPTQPGDDGVFRHPVKSRHIMDAQECVQTVVPEAIIYFCEIVKKSWGRPVLAGAFNGYYISVSGQNRAISGQMLPQLLYQRKDVVDFLCGPCPYMQNRLPECVPMQRAPLESHRLRGMLWLTEMDQYPAGTADHVYGDPDRIDETVAQMRRNVLQPLLGGQGMWFYDHRIVPQKAVHEWEKNIYAAPGSKNPYLSNLYIKKGWWERPEFLKEIKSLHTLAGKYMKKEYAPAADVAIVYNPDVHFHMSRVIDAEYEVQDAVARAGVSYDCMYLRDLEVSDLERYKVIVFANANHLSASQREMIARVTKGKHVVWLYAAGFSDDETMSEENIFRTTSVRVERCALESAYKTLLTGKTVPFPPQYADFNPLFCVNDPDAEKLAVYAQSGKTAAARKGNSWYFGAPLFDPETTSLIMKAAGAHVYTESGDPVLAGNGLVALNSRYGGKRTVTFRSAKKTACDLPPFTTAVFDAETGERVL